MPTKAAKPKPKAKAIAKPKPAAKPVSKPKQDRKQAARLKARRQFRAEQDERREQRPAPPAPAPVASRGFFYGILRFFWLLFHPGKTARDFDAQYKK